MSFSGDVTFTHSEIVQNMAAYGGFITFKGVPGMNGRSSPAQVDFTNTSILSNMAKISGGAFFIIEPFGDIKFPNITIPCNGYPRICNNSGQYYGYYVGGTTRKLIPEFPEPFPGDEMDISVTLQDRFNNTVRYSVTTELRESQLELEYVDSTRPEGMCSAYYSGVAYFRNIRLYSDTKFRVHDTAEGDLLKASFVVTPARCCPPNFFLVCALLLSYCDIRHL